MKMRDLQSHPCITLYCVTWSTNNDDTHSFPYCSCKVIVMKLAFLVSLLLHWKVCHQAVSWNLLHNWLLHPYYVDKYDEPGNPETYCIQLNHTWESNIFSASQILCILWNFKSHSVQYGINLYLESDESSPHPSIIFFEIHCSTNLPFF
jgi:hypothetical protein